MVSVDYTSDLNKPQIINADMMEEMQKEAIEVTIAALKKFNIEKEVATHIRKYFEDKYNPTWHVIVGRNFGSCVTHETKNFIYFTLG